MNNYNDNSRTKRARSDGKARSAAKSAKTKAKASSTTPSPAVAHTPCAESKQHKNPSTPQSGGSPAAKTPSPARPGTSGTVSGIKVSGEVVGGADGLGATTAAASKIVVVQNLPNMPDGDSACPTGPLTPPDSCPTLPDGDCEDHYSAFTGWEAAYPDTPDATEDPTNCDSLNAVANQERRPLPVIGVLRLGQMHGKRENFQQFENADLREVLQITGTPLDTVVEADDDALFTVVDVDTHHWVEPATDEELLAHLFAVTPLPDAAWRSHGNGLKLAYTGRYRQDRALAAALSLPKCFNIELLPHTRHPRSASSKHPGRSCGDLFFFKTQPDEPFEFRHVGNLTPELQREAAEALGLQVGRRYDHDRCPIDGGTDSDARDCITVLDRGVFCHRCAGRGVQYTDYLPPGFFPFSAKLQSNLTNLELLARERVNWAHAVHELKHVHPNLAESLLREAYRKILDAMWGGDDPRIPLVFNRDLDIVWGDGLWLDATTFAPTKFDDDVSVGFPYVLDIEANAAGEKCCVIDRVRRSQAKNRTPRGYTALRPVRGISFIDDDGAIPVTIPPVPHYPIRLLDNPLPLDQAFASLEEAFPRLHRTYLQAVLAAAICGEAGKGQVKMLTCSGPSGSGKEQHIHLGASFMGQTVVKLVLSDGEEAFMRQLGVAISSGHRFLIFDELSKTPKLAQKMKMLLQISSTVQWRPLYESRIVSTPVRAAFFFPCVRFPEFLKKSEEFVRRTRHVHLHRRLPNWAATSGGDSTSWRGRTEQNALIANSILTQVWRMCHAYEYRFFT